MSSRDTRPPRCASVYGTFQCLKIAGHGGPHADVWTTNPVIVWSDLMASQGMPSPGKPS